MRMSMRSIMVSLCNSLWLEDSSDIPTIAVPRTTSKDKKKKKPTQKLDSVEF